MPPQVFHVGFVLKKGFRVLGHESQVVVLREAKQGLPRPQALLAAWLRVHTGVNQLVDILDDLLIAMEVGQAVRKLYVCVCVCVVCIFTFYIASF